MVVQTTLQVLRVFCEITTVALIHRTENKFSRPFYNVQRELHRLFSIIHKTLVDADEGEKYFV